MGPVGPHLLNDAIYLQRFPEISAQEAMALVRAVRLYQDAIWVSESEPALAWLMFVFSIETAADYWRKEKETPIERLRASKPQLEKLLLGKGDKDFVNQVAGLAF